jgi:plastocyanin
MVNIGQVVVGVIVLLVVVGGLLYIFYSRTNAVEKTGYGALIMLALVSLIIPILWIVESGQEASAQVQQFTTGVQSGMQLYAQYCTNNCYTIKNGKIVNPTYNGFTIDQLNAMSDSQLMRTIDAGIYAPGVPTPSPNLLVDSINYGGPLQVNDVTYLFDFLRSADPAYLQKNGYPNHNGFDDLVSYLQANNPSAYATAVALGSPANFGTPVDMTNKSAVTILINHAPPCKPTSSMPDCFQYTNVKVKVGTVITWINQGAVGHTVTAAVGESTAGTLTPAENIFDSAGSASSFNLIQPGKSFSYKVTLDAYNFNPDHVVMYYCKIHLMMIAAITIVQ